MKSLLGESDYAAYVDALQEPPKRFARVNPLKRVPEDALREELGDFPFLPPQASPGKYPLHAAGAYYVQEPAAAAVASMLPPLLPKGAAVLDMCAAPGGKVTGAAAARPDCFFLANEVVYARIKPLLQNVERLGLKNVTVTNLRPEQLARQGARFDAVIADVPCSGEGMMRKSSAAAEEWSEESVRACALRAEKILDSCDDVLKSGGLLLFSTCTFNRTENEAQVFRLMQRGYEPVFPIAPLPHARAGFDLPQAVRFFPQDGGGEGHFACLLRKTAPAPACSKNASVPTSPKKKRVLDFLSQITTEEWSAVVENGIGFEHLPNGYPFGAYPAFRRGVRLVEESGNLLLPHHHLATAANPNALIGSPSLRSTDPLVTAYLRGEAIPLETPRGFRVLRVCGITLGLIKISDGTAKNHYPKGLRI